MIKRNKAIIVISLLVLIAVLAWNYVLYWSGDARKGRENLEKAKRVAIGMSIEDVNNLMGQSNGELVNDKGNIELYYAPPPFSSDGIYFEFEDDSLIRKVEYE